MPISCKKGIRAAFFPSLFFLIIGGMNAEEVHSSDPGPIISVLARHGFENVAVIEDTAEVIITYENRIYRFEVRAVQEVLNLLPGLPAPGKKLILIPQKRGIPIVAVVFGNYSGVWPLIIGTACGECRFVVDAALDVESYWRKLKQVPKSNPSFMKFDGFVHPQFRVQFGNVLDAMESQVNLAPALSMSAWSGMQVSGQWIFPIQNELGTEGDHGRPGLLTLNQTMRLPCHSFVSGTLGYFTQHRYGADLEVKKFWSNGRMAVAAEAGYTGYAEYHKNGWYYSDPDRWTWHLSAETRFAAVDLTVKLTCGRFIYRDTGFRLDAARQFGETAIGFFGLRTDRGRNGGFSISVPLFPSKRQQPKRVRVSPAPYFPWSYRFKGLPLQGLQYSTANSIDEFLFNLNPDFIRNQLIRN